MIKSKNVYALYHGDDFIDLGSKEYLANKLNVKIRTIDFYMTPAYKKRTQCSGWVVIKIEE